MCPRNQVDVMRMTDILLLQEDLRQPFLRDIKAIQIPGDLPILAVNASQRTSREKYSPAASRPRQERLLKKVKPRPCSPHRSIASAISLLNIPVNATRPRTDPACPVFIKHVTHISVYASPKPTPSRPPKPQADASVSSVYTKQLWNSKGT